MASCESFLLSLRGSLGISNIKFSKFDFGRARSVNLRQHSGLRTWIGRKVLFASLSRSYNESKNIFNLGCSPALESEDASVLGATNRMEIFKDTKSSGFTSQLTPNSSEIENLVTEICNTTNITEFELKLAGFELYVRRDLPEKNIPQSLPAPALSTPVNIDTSTKTPGINGSASSTSLTIFTTESSGKSLSFLDRAADEGLAILQSPRVGFFRQSRTIKGKRASPSCKEKQIVKEGQVVCYIEQLGGELPIESDVSGEVIRILREDGEPVGYGDALMAILPSFPGIKKLQ